MKCYLKAVKEIYAGDKLIAKFNNGFLNELVLEKPKPKIEEEIGLTLDDYLDKINIYDTSNRLILTEKKYMLNGYIQLNLGNLISGSYFLMINDHENSAKIQFKTMRGVF